MKIPCKFIFVTAVGLSVAMFSLPGCVPKNPHETAGFFGPIATLRSCISGKVTDSVTGRGIEGATLEIEPAIPDMQLATNQDGYYYAEFQEGSYRLRFTKQGFQPVEQTVQMKPGVTVAWDASLEPTAPVIVNAEKIVSGAAPGATVTLKAAVTIRDGSILKEIRWKLLKDESGVAVRLTDETGSEVKVTLPGLEAYRSSLLKHLRKQGRLLDRWMILGIVPLDIKETSRVTLKVTATTTSGEYDDNVSIFADLRTIAEVNSGLQNVATGKTVLLQGRNQSTYNWSLVAPAGSKAILKDTATRNPCFIPDIAGTYTISEGKNERLTIYAGTWNGAVVARETEQRERWIGAKGCMCHFRDDIRPIFNAWRISGHAEIFTQCVNNIFRYEERCFTCHTVGFGVNGPNGGISSTLSYPAFLQDKSMWDHTKTPPIVKPRPDNYNFMIDNYPDVAKLTNVQCESCHGPNNSEVHKTLKKTGAPERISLNSEVCGQCHDDSIEPSYRQWHESNHSNFNLAIEVGTVEKRGESAGNCGRCHTGQGFVAWIARGNHSTALTGNDTVSTKEYLAARGMTADKVQPVTCAVCHDPHNPGNSFRSKTDKVPVRGSNNARMHPAEFKGETGGRGALCIVCHSTSSGPHNDSSNSRMNVVMVPHATQADVMFGQNVFFASVGKYKSHSRIEDTCIWCHVKTVPKFSERGYPRGGVNHTFKSSAKQCTVCHKEIKGNKEIKVAELMDAIDEKLEGLKKQIEDAIRNEFTARSDLRLEKSVSGSANHSLRAADIREIFLINLDGEVGIEVGLQDGGIIKAPVSHISLGNDPLLSTGNGQVIAKASWNYFFLKNDNSRGAHNPQFFTEVLNSTRTKVSALQRN